MLNQFRRVMNYKISVATLIEIWLWLAITYLTIGLVWSGFNPVYAQQIETNLLKGLPAGSEPLAYVDAALLWPVLMFASGICPA